MVLPDDQLDDFWTIFEEARYSDHTIDASHRDRALGTLGAIQGSLTRALGEEAVEATSARKSSTCATSRRRLASSWRRRSVRQAGQDDGRTTAASASDSPTDAVLGRPNVEGVGRQRTAWTIGRSDDQPCGRKPPTSLEPMPPTAVPCVLVWARPDASGRHRGRPDHRGALRCAGGLLAAGHAPDESRRPKLGAWITLSGRASLRRLVRAQPPH